jgi:hypothetical protein
MVNDLAKLEGGTWTDRLRLDQACACVAARRGDRTGALDALDRADGRVRDTDSVLDQAITAASRAVVLDALGDAEAEAASEEARGALAALGIDGSGWWSVFRRAVGRG